MVDKLKNYLYTYRKRSGLTQKDVAYLLGHYDGTQVSRHERSRQTPTLITALAYQVIFDIPVQKLLPGLYREVEAVINQRAGLLSKELKADVSDRRARRKLTVLKMIQMQKGGNDENEYEVIH